LPNDTEWETLINYAGGGDVAGKKLKATSGWDDYAGIYGNGTNDYGFSALPGGHGFSDRYGNEGSNTFHYAGNRGFWHSATKNNFNGLGRAMIISSEAEIAEMVDDNKGVVISVRCIKDNGNSN